MNARALSIARAVGAIGATGALILGVTLAVTTTNSVDAAGTVSVSDGLQISDPSDGPYASSATGFAFPTHPGSPSASIPHTHMYLVTTEPTGTVVLSARITQWDANLSAEASHLTLNFKLGGNSTWCRLALSGPATTAWPRSVVLEPRPRTTSRFG